MKQFTMNMDPAFLLAATRHALQNGTNLSDLVRTTLAREIGWSPAPDEVSLDDGQAMAVLLRYSEGGISRREAMQDLGLRAEHTPAFVEAMNRMSIAWPVPDPDRIASEAQLVVDAIRGDDDED